MCKVDKAASKRIHLVCADLILLARFVAGITGVVGSQEFPSAPQDIPQAVSLALAVQDAE